MRLTNEKMLLASAAIFVLIIGAIWFITHSGSDYSTEGLATTTTSIASSTNSQSASSTTNTNTQTKQPTSRPSPRPTGSGTSAPSHAPTLVQFIPAAGTPGTSVTIEGTNFDRTTNYITFGTSAGRHHPDGSPDNVTAVVGSPDGKTVTFTIPANGPSGLLCDSSNHCVAIAAIATQPGTYPVTVYTKAGTSNTLIFTVQK